MEFKKNSGNVYYFKTDKTEDPKNCFSPTSEINSNFNKLYSLKLLSNKAYAITSNNELLQWKSEINTQNEDSLSESKPDDAYLFLLKKPSYRFHKIKFRSITLNKSVCFGLDVNGNVLVWGQSNEGILGLGYDIVNVQKPTILEELKDIKDISLSDHHAVAINSSGVAYSWGTGKYGELGLERTIYIPVPQQILTDTCYSRVFCGNLITCFLDNEGHFYYFGVVIKQLTGSSSTLTIKSLLDEQIYNDGKILFIEKQIEELENEKFINIIIGNGFICLLTFNGVIFTLEYNDKLTKLYSKYYLFNISVENNKIYGLAKERNNNKYNYYLLRWVSSYSSENDLYSDSWNTTIWRFLDDFNIMDKCKLLDINSNEKLLFLKVSDLNEKDNLNNTILEHNKGELDLSNNNEIPSHLDNTLCMNSNTNLKDEMNINTNHKIFNDKFLEFESEYDDSYNLKYKRNQSNNIYQEMGGKTFVLHNNISNSFFANNKNLSFSPNMNMNKTVIFQNKSTNPLYINSKNMGNFEKNGIKSSNKKNNTKGNIFCNSNGEFGTGKYNKNDISDNVNIYEIESNNNRINNKNNKRNNNKNGNENISTYEYNSDDNEFKEKELKIQE